MTDIVQRLVGIASTGLRSFIAWVNAATCSHPPEKTTADVNEGDAPGVCIQWCRLCGSYRYVGYTHDETHGIDGDSGAYGPWMLPGRKGYLESDRFTEGVF